MDAASGRHAPLPEGEPTGQLPATGVGATPATESPLATGETPETTARTQAAFADNQSLLEGVPSPAAEHPAASSPIGAKITIGRPRRNAATLQQVGRHARQRLPATPRARGRAAAVTGSERTTVQSAARTARKLRLLKTTLEKYRDPDQTDIEEGDVHALIAYFKEASTETGTRELATLHQTNPAAYEQFHAALPLDTQERVAAKVVEQALSEIQDSDAPPLKKLEQLSTIPEPQRTPAIVAFEQQLVSELMSAELDPLALLQSLSSTQLSNEVIRMTLFEGDTLRPEATSLSHLHQTNPQTYQTCLKQLPQATQDAVSKQLFTEIQESDAPRSEKLERLSTLPKEQRTPELVAFELQLVTEIMGEGVSVPETLAQLQSLNQFQMTDEVIHVILFDGDTLRPEAYELTATQMGNEIRENTSTDPVRRISPGTRLLAGFLHAAGGQWITGLVEGTHEAVLDRSIELDSKRERKGRTAKQKSVKKALKNFLSEPKDYSEVSTFLQETQGLSAAIADKMTQAFYGSTISKENREEVVRTLPDLLKKEAMQEVTVGVGCKILSAFRDSTRRTAENPIPEDFVRLIHHLNAAGAENAHRPATETRELNPQQVRTFSNLGLNLILLRGINAALTVPEAWGITKPWEEQRTPKAVLNASTALQRAANYHNKSDPMLVAFRNDLAVALGIEDSSVP